MKYLTRACFWIGSLTILSLPCSAWAEKPQAWSVRSTVEAAISYNPALKQEQESRRIAEQNLRQAKAGHLPRIDVQGGAGWRTISVPKK